MGIRFHYEMAPPEFRKVAFALRKEESAFTGVGTPCCIAGYQRVQPSNIVACGGKPGSISYLFSGSSAEDGRRTPGKSTSFHDASVRLPRLFCKFSLVTRCIRCTSCSAASSRRDWETVDLLLAVLQWSSLHTATRRYMGSDRASSPYRWFQTLRRPLARLNHPMVWPCGTG